MDLSEHKLKDWKELTEVQSKDKDRFNSFVHRTYNTILGLRVGECFNISKNVAIGSQSLFVKVVCMAICEGYDFEFSDDYTQVRRTSPVEPIKQKIRKEEKDEKGE